MRILLLGVVVSTLVTVVSLSGCEGAPDRTGEGEGEGEGEAPLCPPLGPFPDLVVNTNAGPIRGVDLGAVRAFLGVRYASVPGRFLPPAAPSCHVEVVDAAAFPEGCVRTDFVIGSDVGTPMGVEDCLQLNVWAPQTAGPHPTLVFIHGGGHIGGSTGELLGDGPARLLDGRRLAEAENVVVVTIEYRLGVFGFLAHRGFADDDTVTANAGILDQLAALRWVHDHIAAFGGDPERVLLFGESAGAVDTCIIAGLPQAHGLFSTSLVQSGACVARPLEQANDEADDVAAALGCSGTDAEVLACLKDPARVTVADAQAILEHPFSGGTVTQSFGPVIDGDVIAIDPIVALEETAVPFIIGSNAEETRRSVPPGTVTASRLALTFAAFAEPERSELNALYPAGSTDADARESYIRATTDGQFTCPARRAARAAARSGQPVFAYVYDHALPGLAGAFAGASHGTELPLLFQSIRDTPSANLIRSIDDDVMALLGEEWQTSARTGAPSSRWPRWSESADQHLRLAPIPDVVTDFRAAACDVWDRARPR
jgi:para-nitrobenzyl esterase